MGMAHHSQKKIMNKLLFFKIAVLAAATLAPCSIAQVHQEHMEVRRETDHPPHPPQQAVCPHCGRAGEGQFFQGEHGHQGRRPMIREERRIFRLHPGDRQGDVLIRRPPTPPPPPGGPGGFGGGGIIRREFRGGGGPDAEHGRPDIRPFPEGERMQHLHEAIRHLREGGFPEIAERLEQQAARMREELRGREARGDSDSPQQLRKLEQERDELRKEVRKLRHELEEIRPSKEKKKEPVKEQN